jgi:DNA-binding winged helix-turn-helix (wHTH) protein/TolB-like protein
MEAPFARPVYRFGLFEVDPDGKRLVRLGKPVKLQEQPLRVLCLLLGRPGEVVTREDLRKSLWPAGTHVEFDGSLNAILKRLRSALGDDADNPIFIQTVPRQGYRFIAPVESKLPSETGAAATPAGPFESPGLQQAGGHFFSLQRWRLRLLWMLAATALLIAVLGWRYTKENRPSPPLARRVVAVLPFSNQGASPDFDYLRYAIPSDVVTDLTYARSVSVRPFGSSSRYASQSADPSAIGKELRVTHVVVGGFLTDKANLRVNLELVDVEANRAVWREEVTVAPHEIVALHDKLAVRIAKGLLPAISAAVAEIPAPKNDLALDLFLHSFAIPLDPEPNLLAIKKLEESVALDSSYAPAWEELSRRYGIDYQYGNGGEAAVAKALAANKRLSELDPDWPEVATPIRVERGDLNGAYDQAADLLRRRPDVAPAHHSMSYVLRYAGLLDEANKECDAAFALDPGYNGFRSCAVPYILQGDYARAQTSIRLDEHSGFGAMLRMIIALRTGDNTAALSESNAAQKAFRFAGLARLYLSHAPEAELRKAAADLEVEPRSSRDPETRYFNAAALSFCGQRESSFRELARAIKGNYCSYPALDKDPLFDPIRRRPEFAELRQAGIQCQQNFLAHRAQVDSVRAAP